MEHCSHLWGGVPQYQLNSIDRTQRRAVCIIGDSMIYERLDNLALRRNVSSLCILYRIYRGECFRELIEQLPAVEISNHTVYHKIKYHPNNQTTWKSDTTLLCGLVRTSFNAPQNRGIPFLKLKTNRVNRSLK